jgi:hypothetical protein
MVADLQSLEVVHAKGLKPGLRRRQKGVTNDIGASHADHYRRAVIHVPDPVGRKPVPRSDRQQRVDGVFEPDAF